MEEKMEVQIIQYMNNEAYFQKWAVISPLHEPSALDDYYINIIDLSVPQMWACKDDASGIIDSVKDLDTICQMVANKKKSVIIYVMPQNTAYQCFTKYPQRRDRLPIKDVITPIYNHSIMRAIPQNTSNSKMLYEKTVTTVSGVSYNADFYFSSPKDVITQSDRSEKSTTIKLATGIYATTLNITKNIESLHHFIVSVFQKEKHSAVPDWMAGIEFNDDNVQKEIVDISEKEINAAQERICAAKKKLEENAKIKSILYTNGDELVTVIIKILEQLLNCDLSDFKDKKREDFLIKLQECTFIGEIKGVTSNIKYEHITQVELHFRGYLDELIENNLSEEVKQLLIMNPFRTKPLDQREPVHIAQIDLAVRNNCLIIETRTLLRVYEKFCSGELSTAECIRVFKEKAGLLELSDF